MSARLPDGLSPEERRFCSRCASSRRAALREPDHDARLRAGRVRREPDLRRDAGRRCAVPLVRTRCDQCRKLAQRPRGAADQTARGLRSRAPPRRPTGGAPWTSAFRRRRDRASTAWRSRPRASGRWSRAGTGSGSRRTRASTPGTRPRTTSRPAPRSRTAARRSSRGRRWWPRSSRPSLRTTSDAPEGPGRLRLLGPAGGPPRGLPSAAAQRGHRRRHRGDRGRRRARARAHERCRRSPGSLAVVARQRPAAERVRRQGHPARRACPGCPRPTSSCSGAGVLGRAAARAAIGLGAHVHAARRAAWATCATPAEHLPRRVTTMLATRPTSRRRSPSPTSCSGRWRCAAQRAPILVTRDMLRLMKPRTRGDGPLDRHGRLLRDLAAHLASPAPPTRWTASCTSACRTCPSVAARSATLALTNATAALPAGRWPTRASRRALAAHPELARGTYLYRGHCASESLARAFELASGARRRGGGVSRWHWSETYRRRVTTAEEAVKSVGSGDHVWIHAGCNNPEELVKALVARAGELRDVEVTHLLTFGGRRPRRSPVLADSSATAPSSPAATCAQAVNEGRADFVPVFLSEIPRPDSTTGRSRSTWPSSTSRRPTSTASAPTAWASSAPRRPRRRARTVIALVNRQMPRSLGRLRSSTSRASTHVVEIDRPVLELPQVDARSATWPGRSASTSPTLIEDGSTLQMGIGEIPDAVLLFLKREARPGHPHRDVLGRRGRAVRERASSPARPRRCTRARSSPRSCSGSQADSSTSSTTTRSSSSTRPTT